MTKQFFLLVRLLLACFVGLSGPALQGINWSQTLVDYPNISNAQLEMICYYLLPDDHPIKPELDAFFSLSRVTQDEESLLKAQFIDTKFKPNSQTVVTKHPQFKGYVFKLFTDEQDKPDHIHSLFKRIIGAEAVRGAIERTKSEHLFMVPHKWLYFIPPVPSKYTPKECLLVAEEVALLPYGENVKKWKSNKVPQSTLKALYEILSEVGLSDSIYPSNIQFTQDGKIAFVDTECAYWWPNPPLFHVLGDYLSDENREYWLSLTN